MPITREDLTSRRLAIAEDIARARDTLGRLYGAYNEIQYWEGQLAGPQPQEDKNDRV